MNSYVTFSLGFLAGMLIVLWYEKLRNHKFSKFSAGLDYCVDNTEVILNYCSLDACQIDWANAYINDIQRFKKITPSSVYRENPDEAQTKLESFQNRLSTFKRSLQQQKWQV